MESEDTWSLSILSDLCGRDKNSENPNARRLPIFFIDGIEELFFKMDFGCLDRDGREKLRRGGIEKLPLLRKFSICLRKDLQQVKRGVFCGAVRDCRGEDYEATLAEGGYLFFLDNFALSIV